MPVHEMFTAKDEVELASSSSAATLDTEPRPLSGMRMLIGAERLCTGSASAKEPAAAPLRVTSMLRLVTSVFTLAALAPR